MVKRTLARPLHPAKAQPKNQPMAHLQPLHRVLNGRQSAIPSETAACTKAYNSYQISIPI